jgi:hypothetical protein
MSAKSRLASAVTLRESGGIIFQYHFTNGFGASITCLPGSYGSKEGLFELAVLQRHRDGKYDITYKTPITADVIGWLGWDEIEPLLKQIEALETPND